MPVKRVAVIGAGPSGAITVDALAKEGVFDVIRVFERREGPGGCWIGDTTPPPNLTNLPALAARTADPPVAIPAELPTRQKKNPKPSSSSSSSSSSPSSPPSPATSRQPRFAESSIYPYLETNVDDVAMSFTGGGAESIPDERSAWSVAMHGPDTPFRHWEVLRRYVAGLFGRDGYGGLVAYETCVERIVKEAGSGEWVLTLRREVTPTAAKAAAAEEGGGGKEGGGMVDEEGEGEEEWWTERFDGVVVASGHFNVPWVPPVEGLEEFERARPGSVLHSKMYRGRDAFKGKHVVVVGASVSGADIAYDLASSNLTSGPVHAVVVGHTFNPYFGDVAFDHPNIHKCPSIARVDPATRAVHLVDGTTLRDVDHLIFGTGYTWSLPFLSGVLAVRNNRVPGLYQHVVWREDPTLLFVGGVGAGLTFKIFEWQAVYAARLLAGRGRLPPYEEMVKWEEDRVRKKGDGPGFLTIHPDFEEYFETVRGLAGEPTERGEGRRLPEYERRWFQTFMDGHELRKRMWRRRNEEARKEREQQQQEQQQQSHL